MPTDRHDEAEIKVVKVPMLDTGIGREAGYGSDAELIEAAKAEREAMDPVIRDLTDKAEAEFERRLLYGDRA